MSTHDLKIWPEHFRDLVEGRKTMTLRRDDRGFKEGDLLLLREWDRFGRAYTGREAERTVSLVTRGCTVAGLEPGYAILSLVEPDRARWGAFITHLAEALAVRPVSEAVEEEALLREVARLKARAGEDDRLGQLLQLLREAHQYAFLGSAPRAKTNLAEACRLLAALIDGRG